MMSGTTERESRKTEKLIRKRRVRVSNEFQ